MTTTHPMEFVIGVLEQVFGMGLQEATRIMLHVHQRGDRGVRRLYL